MRKLLLVFVFISCKTQPIFVDIPTEPVVNKIEPPKKNIVRVVTIPEPILERTYVTRKGDSLWKIARKFGLKTYQIAGYNNISLNSFLQIGQKLRIPPVSSLDKIKNPQIISPRPIRRDKSYNVMPKNKIYYVKSGDSLWKIAQKFNLKTKDLMENNNLKRTNVYIGQALLLEKKGQEEKIVKVNISSKNNSPDKKLVNTLDKLKEEYKKKGYFLVEHPVKQGETLESIAKSWGANYNDVKKFNPQYNNSNLKKGTVIIIPIL